jgi:iron-sulfur cluster repair protein YtfE (RIC family)
MSIFEMLKEEHDRIRDLFRIVMAEARKADTFEDLRMELDRHMQGEEEYVYPEIRETGLKDRVLDSIEQHHVARILLEELEEMSELAEAWTPKLRVLREQLERHLQKEENAVFPEARRSIAETRQEELGDEYSRFESAFTHAGASLPQSELPFYRDA